MSVWARKVFASFADKKIVGIIAEQKGLLQEEDVDVIQQLSGSRSLAPLSKSAAAR